MTGALVSPAQWLAIAVFVFLAVLASGQLGPIWRGSSNADGRTG
jgi:hypothetical protein